MRGIDTCVNDGNFNPAAGVEIPCGGCLNFGQVPLGGKVVVVQGGVRFKNVIWLGELDVGILLQYSEDARQGTFRHLHNADIDLGKVLELPGTLEVKDLLKDQLRGAPFRLDENPAGDNPDGACAEANWSAQQERCGAANQDRLRECVH